MDTIVDGPPTLATPQMAFVNQASEAEVSWDESSWEMADFNADFEANLNLSAPFQP